MLNPECHMSPDSRTRTQPAEFARHGT
jgi:hypothetical protein